MNSPSSRPPRRSEIPAHISRVAQALFDSGSYARVTMEQIARQAGVSKRTLYKYFPAKEALLEQFLEAVLAQDLARRDSSPRANTGFRASVTALLLQSAQWCGQHEALLLPYIRYKFATFDPGTASADERGLLPAWTTLIAAGQDRGELDPSRDAAQLGTYFHYLYLGALMRWLTKPQLDLRQEFEAVVALFVDGTASPRKAGGSRK